MSILDKAKQIRLSREPQARPLPDEPIAASRPCDISVQSDQSPTPTDPSRPPAGVRLFFGRADGCPTAPDAEGDDAVYHWTWERGPGWFYAAEVGLPAWEMRLRPGLYLRCKVVTHRGTRIVWRNTTDGRKQLRCECAECGKLIKVMRAPPKCPDVEFIARAS